MRLVLGSAQFGGCYGITNTRGQVNKSELADIVSAAFYEGIDLVDTAVAYGNAEARLGRCCPKEMKFVSKVPAVPQGINDIQDWLVQQVFKSLSDLKVSQLYGLLAHDSSQLLGENGKAVRSAFFELRERGVVQKFGVSVYSPAELAVLGDNPMMDLVQAPFSLVDRRLQTTGWLKKLKRRGVEIHARSIFLQGLLLRSSKTLPEQFRNWQKVWREWDDWLLRNYPISRIEACLGFVGSFQEIDKLVVGVETVEQLRSLVRASQAEVPDSWPDISSSDEALVHPFNWLKA